MAKDDYHVLAYRILAYLYACLKDGTKPDLNYLSYDSKVFNIAESYWEYIITHLYEDGLVEGIYLIPMSGRSNPGIKYDTNFMITPKGIEFLQNNSSMNRAKEFLKTIKEVVPGL